MQRDQDRHLNAQFNRIKLEEEKQRKLEQIQTEIEFKNAKVD